MDQVGLSEHLKQGWFWIQVGGWKSILFKHRWDFISIANNHVYSQQQLRGGSALDEGSGGDYHWAGICIVIFCLPKGSFVPTSNGHLNVYYSNSRKRPNFFSNL